jgi:hypothetical protein
MATFLTTRRMHPALAERVEASVRGKRAKPGRRLVAIVRFAVALLVVGVAAAFLLLRRQEKQGIEHERSAILAKVRAHSSTLTAEEKGSLAVVEAALVRFAGTYEGDFIATELCAPHALADVVARPAVYVRGPLAAFTNAKSIAAAAAASGKDALALCLLEPPASRAEKTVMAKVRESYGGAEVKTSNMRRLHEEEVGLALLTPAWEERVNAARDARDLADLRKELERAPIERAKQAARASVLLVAMDEPSDVAGPADLDGERAHPVRVGLIALPSAKALFRLRRRVDPSAWSTAARAQYSSGLDACALALDIYEAAAQAR